MVFRDDYGPSEKDNKKSGEGVKSKIDRLKVGKERFSVYADKEYKQRKEKILREFEKKKNEIEKKYKEIIEEYNKPEKREEISKETLERLDIALNLSSEEKETIKESLNISEMTVINPYINKLEQKKNLEIKKVEKEYNDNIAKLNGWLEDFIYKYEEIFDDRIQKIKSQLENVSNEINSANEKINLASKEKEIKESTYAGEESATGIKYNKRRNIFTSIILGGAVALSLISINKLFNLIDQKNRENFPPAIKNYNSTQFSKIYLTSIPTTSIKEERVDLSKDKKYEKSGSKEPNAPNVLQVKTTKSKESTAHSVKKDKAIMKKAKKKSSLNISIKKLRSSVKKVGYDGIPILKSSTESHINDFLDKIEKMKNKLSEYDKKNLNIIILNMTESLEIYNKIMENPYRSDYERKKAKGIKKYMLKSIKWLSAQESSSEAIEYLAKTYPKKLNEYKK